MKSREEKLETLLAACYRLISKEIYYQAQVPKILETDFKVITSLVNSISELDLELKVKEEKGDLA